MKFREFLDTQLKKEIQVGKVEVKLFVHQEALKAAIQ